ncbi:MAG: PKD domain-containing protein [Rudaea sp.]
MKIRIALLALVALFSNVAFAAGTFSIYFNAEDVGHCSASGVSSTSVLPDGNLLALTGTNPPTLSAACGLSGSGQQLTFGPAQPLQGPVGALPSGSNQIGNFSVLPLNAATCTVAIATTGGSGVATGPVNGYVCGLGTTPSCTSNTLIPFSASFTNTGSSSSSYQATLTCLAAPGASPASLTSQANVTQNGNSGGTPVANFTFTTNGLTANFTDTSTDVGGTINQWSWDFGDGGTSTQQNPPHTYTLANTYNVKLTVTDSVSGNPSSITKPVTVSGVIGPSCTNGASGDIPGYTALCSGNMTLYNPGQHNLGPSPYSFPFVFGGNWPGTYFGDAVVFSLPKTQFLSIPFTPTPGHSINFVVNGSYTHNPVTFSISTSAGLFNNGAKGNGVVCVKSNAPNLTVSSNGYTPINCVLNPTTQYWFNAVNATHNASGWNQQCGSSSCSMGFNENQGAGF